MVKGKRRCCDQQRVAISTSLIITRLYCSQLVVLLFQRNLGHHSLHRNKPFLSDSSLDLMQEHGRKKKFSSVLFFNYVHINFREKSEFKSSLYWKMREAGEFGRREKSESPAVTTALTPSCSRVSLETKSNWKRLEKTGREWKKAKTVPKRKRAPEALDRTLTSCWLFSGQRRLWETSSQRSSWFLSCSSLRRILSLCSLVVYRVSSRHFLFLSFLL